MEPVGKKVGKGGMTNQRELEKLGLSGCLRWGGNGVLENNSPFRCGSYCTNKCDVRACFSDITGSVPQPPSTKLGSCRSCPLFTVGELGHNVTGTRGVRWCRPGRGCQAAQQQARHPGDIHFVAGRGGRGSPRRAS